MVSVEQAAEATARMPVDIGGDVVRAGAGRVGVELSNGRSTITRLQCGSPLKLLAPGACGKAAWIVTSSFGGGLLAGDSLDVELSAGAGTHTLVTTQSATKVFRSTRQAPCRQHAHVTAGAGALVAWLPEALICCRDAVYEQRQRFSLNDGASLVMLDSLSSGRRARGEAWCFERYRAQTEIHIDGQLLLRDAMLLDREDGAIDTPLRTGGCHCLATLILVGPMLAEPSRRILAEFAARPLERNAPLLAAASPLANGAILRVGGDGPEQVYAFIRQCLAFLPALLGDDPWRGKW